VVLVVIFAIRGYVRGSMGQIFALFGLIAGLWVVGVTSQWVGAHWHGARPAVVFLLLRWLVAGLAGLAIASVFQWAGERIRETVHAGPIAWLDRSLGVPIGAAVGVVLAALILMVALEIPRPRRVAETAAHASITPRLMSGGARVCALGDSLFPGGRWLGRQFTVAGRRARLRSHGS
jgi:hypothetical protein